MDNKKPRRVGYIFNRSRRDAAHMNVDVQPRDGLMHLFIDAPGTRRQNLGAMIDPDALRPGDVIVVCALSDFGKGQEASRIVAMIEAQGARVEVEASPAPKRGGKRLTRKHPRRWDACLIWWSVLDQPDAMIEMGKVLGRDIDRNQANRLCGMSRNPDNATREAIKAECAANETE